MLEREFSLLFLQTILIDVVEVVFPNDTCPYTGRCQKNAMSL